MTPGRDEDSVNEALEEIEAIIEIIDEELPEWKYEKGEDFFESVREKLTGIDETISETGVVTQGQITAIENMGQAVRNWLD